MWGCTLRHVQPEPYVILLPTPAIVVPSTRLNVAALHSTCQNLAALANSGGVGVLLHEPNDVLDDTTAATRLSRPTVDLIRGGRAQGVALALREELEELVGEAIIFSDFSIRGDDSRLFDADAVQDALIRRRVVLIVPSSGFGLFESGLNSIDLARQLGVQVYLQCKKWSLEDRGQRNISVREALEIVEANNLPSTVVGRAKDYGIPISFVDFTASPASFDITFRKSRAVLVA
jgi:hypothetical protein